MTLKISFNSAEGKAFATTTKTDMWTEESLAMIDGDDTTSLVGAITADEFSE